MKKRKFIKIMYAVTPVMLVLLLALNVFTLVRVRALEADANGETEDVAQEDDVVIGEEYTIKSTKQISDAYKSGDSSKLSERDEETLDMAKAILGKIITKDMSDYEKELAVYDWMTANLSFDDGSMEVVPDTDTECDNPYGVLKYHNAVCVGYATTFRMFMQMMDIECMVVHDSYLSHSWNLVKLDGHWYHTDIFSDTPGGNHSHFNINDDVMTDMQEWNTDFFPAADGYEYNYAYINRAQCKDVYSIPALVRSAIDSKSSLVSLDFGKNISENTYDTAEDIMSEIEDRVMFGSNAKIGLGWYWLDAGDDRVFCVYISYEDDAEDPDDDTDEPDENQQKISDAVDKAFGDFGSGDNNIVGIE